MLTRELFQSPQGSSPQSVQSVPGGRFNFNHRSQEIRVPSPHSQVIYRTLYALRSGVLKVTICGGIFLICVFTPNRFAGWTASDSTPLRWEYIIITHIRITV